DAVHAVVEQAARHVASTAKKPRRKWSSVPCGFAQRNRRKHYVALFVVYVKAEAQVHIGFQVPILEFEPKRRLDRNVLTIVSFHTGTSQAYLFIPRRGRNIFPKTLNRTMQTASQILRNNCDC